MTKKIIVGLGNIGIAYENTRHNIGFEVLDFLAKEHKTIFENKKYAGIAKFTFKGTIFILIKPTTFMNLSGKAVKFWMEKEKINLKNVLVICDDLYLDFGVLRIKPKGSSAGHNGLKDIALQINTQNYARMRFGIGADFYKGKQSDFVLEKWNEKEQKNLPFLLKKTSEAVISFGKAGLENTMNFYNKNHLKI